MWNYTSENETVISDTKVEVNISFESQDALSNEFSEFSVTDYLGMALGPQRLPLENVIPMTIVNAVMFITGVFGNLSVCCVILRIPSMRSATNYYLFSLAVADLLILLLGKKKKSNFITQHKFFRPIVSCIHLNVLLLGHFSKFEPKKERLF